MIEILGVTLTVETLITLGVALAVDELLPFLPTKANGIIHAIMLGLKKAKISRIKTPGEKKLDLVLAKLEALQEIQETGSKIDRVVRDIQGRGR